MKYLLSVFASLLVASIAAAQCANGSCSAGITVVRMQAPPMARASACSSAATASCSGRQGLLARHRQNVAARRGTAMTVAYVQMSPAVSAQPTAGCTCTNATAERLPLPKK